MWPSLSSYPYLVHEGFAKLGVNHYQTTVGIQGPKSQPAVLILVRTVGPEGFDTKKQSAMKNFMKLTGKRPHVGCNATGGAGRGSWRIGTVDPHMPILSKALFRLLS
jgi:hypothetical protein